MPLQIPVLNFGDLLRKMRIVRVSFGEGSQELERSRRLLFVPQVHQVQLVVRFAPKQLTTVSARSISARPSTPIAARQEQQPSQHPRRCGRDCRVVVIQADSEVGVLKRGIKGESSFEGLLDPLAIAGGGQRLTAQCPPLRSSARSHPPR